MPVVGYVEYGGLVVPKFSYMEDIKTRFEDSDPDRLANFNKIFQHASLKFPVTSPADSDKSTEERNQYIRAQISTLFANEPDLIDGYNQYIKEAKDERTKMGGPQVEFVNKVNKRFENDPDRLAAFWAPYNLAMKQMLSDPPAKDPGEVWQGTYEGATAALEGESDLLEEFDAFFERVKVGNLGPI
ncbi:hypothetical protein BT63DRAFT_414980 [Microthyrium microscopicum]|uniref:Uncharacterized protein n=1 Tax=Microthyrium microscopicum TaxID=703497 RepID=A0A6A6U933_9PEZI|nr:hypothetical protein BT63DRAFT_414980 [Microthyrium microscopicum]